MKHDQNRFDRTESLVVRSFFEYCAHRMLPMRSVWFHAVLECETG
jgi:hypothetical protein